jgi:hypothetical protein
MHSWIQIKLYTYIIYIFTHHPYRAILNEIRVDDNFNDIYVNQFINSIINSIISTSFLENPFLFNRNFHSLIVRGICIFPCQSLSSDIIITLNKHHGCEYSCNFRLMLSTSCSKAVGKAPRYHMSYLVGWFADITKHVHVQTWARPRALFNSLISSWILTVLLIFC